MKLFNFSNRKKLKGTISLLRQSLLAIAAISVAGLIMIYAINYSIGLIVFGVSLFAIGGIIIIFRRIIWDDYVKSHRVRSGWISTLSQPTRLVYWLNVAIVWPFAMIVGAIAVLAGLIAN